MFRHFRSKTALQLRLALERDPLARLANKYLSDKGTLRFERHGYTRVYSELFSPLRDKRIRLLELGLQNRATYPQSRYKKSVPSMLMWRDYFPKAELFGFDIVDFSDVTLDGMKTFQGDGGSRDSLMKMAEEFGGNFDVIIDDASHYSHHQLLGFDVLFPYVKQGGFYIIEDLHWQPDGDQGPKTRDILSGRSDVMFFDSMGCGAVFHRDALAVIQKAD